MQEAMNGKATKFRALAEKRTTKVIRTVRQIGNLSGSAYDSSPDQVEQMFNTIRRELDAAQKRFSPPDKKEQPVFRFE